ncbi:MAG TPA: CCA tRNA nucleotidyltransferase [Alphaproteobacteria bacterium]
MKSALSIDPPEWLKDPALLQVMHALGAGNALLVGGAVRGAILGEKVTDIDIATNQTPDQVLARMKDAGIRTVPTGIEHGTITAVIDKRHFEITTLRQDVHTDGRHAEVAFSKDWVQDAKRRDFTINTLLMDMDAHIYDPTHQGIDDLKAGLIRFVGNPGRRINEDFLRILRFFRFHARYGKGRPDLEGVRACIRASENIAKLSRERVTQEFEKILPTKGAGEVIEQLREYDILPGVISPDFDQGKYRDLQKLIADRSSQNDLKLLFAYSVCRNDIEVPFDVLDKTFVLSNALRAFLTKNIEFIRAQPASINQNLYHFGKDISLSGTVLYGFLKDKQPQIAKLEGLIDQINTASVPVLPINGSDVAQVMGIMPGEDMGAAIKDIETWWLNEDAKPGRTQVLDYMRKKSVA